MLFTLLACITRESFPEAYAAASCDLFERCGTDWESAAEEGESCEEWVIENADLTAYTESSAWDGALAAACVHETRTAEDCTLTTGVRPSCEELWDDDV